MTGPFRTAAGGLIDRDRRLSFTFDGKRYEGHPGDTLASALLANGVRVMGRSFKYHRPRGVLGASIEEPNALVGVGESGRFEPNTRATDIFLYPGLTATSQNRWPSLALDAGAVNQVLAPFIPVGFYYKTFFGGPRLWKVYERFIRQAAGLGAAPTLADPETFEHRAVFCDVLVVGAGPAGLAAGLAAARAGAKVILVDQDNGPGGSLTRDPAEIMGRPAEKWAGSVVDEIRAFGGRVLTRTTATGFHDQGLLTLVERLVEAGQPQSAGPAQRLWRARARRVVLAQGAVERPLLFAGNDKPGIMLASAARTFASRYGVRAGSRVVVSGCDDHIYLTALCLAGAGVKVAAVLDARPNVESPLAARAGDVAPIHLDARLTAARGGPCVRAATATAGGRTIDIACDLIAMSGGQTPLVHLHMQAGGGLAWDDSAGAFNPVEPRQNQDSAGAAAGHHGLAEALADGWRAGVAAIQALGLRPPPEEPLVTRADLLAPSASGSAYGLPTGSNPKTAFIDFQNDVTASDVDLAWREGYRSVEHLKRYTTLGMATDQGKTSNLPGLARLAAASGRTPPEAGLTTFRPPFTPVTFGALAGEAVGGHAAPVRRLPLYDAHRQAGAVWQPSGHWMRPRAYPVAGETLAQAARREARAVRLAVGLSDVSTLAKFEIAGPDAAPFLELICATSVGRLAVGRGRYTVMLREDGVAADDGTVWRLEPTRYLMTSSTGGSETMAHHLAYVRGVLASDLRVTVASVQERWAAVALAGPKARDLLARITGAPPPAHMGLAKASIGGQQVLLLGASYSGERAFEVYAPSFAVFAVWQALSEAVAAVNGGPYGLDAMDLLRIEKGHIVTGAEIDGRLSPHDLGLSRMLRKRGYIGWAALQRTDFLRPDRLRLVGVEALDGVLPEGAMILPSPGAPPQGHVSSAGYRVLGDGAIGLALVTSGPDRLGETMIVSSPTRALQGRVRLVEPLFYDAEGTRYRD
jgi:sarcosine oxidase subunit alpha